MARYSSIFRLNDIISVEHTLRYMTIVESPFITSFCSITKPRKKLLNVVYLYPLVILF
jgi:hypothetical protein